MWAVAAFPLQGGKNSLLAATVEPYSVSISGMLTSTYPTVGAFFLQRRFKQLKQATYFLPLSHTLPDAGGGSLLARRVVRSMYVQVHLCVLGIGWFLGTWSPWTLISVHTREGGP